MNHTPGPWEIIDIDIGLDNPIYVPSEIVGVDGFPIVSCNGGLFPNDPTMLDRKYTFDELWGNAKIMIEAENMYKALIEIRKRLDNLQTDLDGIYDIANDAINDVELKKI